MKLIMIYRSS